MRVAVIAGVLGLVAVLGTAGQAAAQSVSRGTGAVLRVLDKVTGETREHELANGGTVAIGRLMLGLSECRYPEGDPGRDAFALLQVRNETTEVIFSGWMIASSPALNTLDHRRYDVWVIRCNTA